MQKWLPISIALLLIAACSTSPTGRKQILLFSEQQLAAMGQQSFTSMKADLKVAQQSVQNNYVQCIAEHIIAQLPNDDPSQWEIVVFDNEQSNAFALPGKKIGVYTGILKVATDQHQVAAIIGHEVGHVLAQHANERVSTGQLASLGNEVANRALDNYDSEYSTLIRAALGLGTQYGVLLPFSRTHESEADLIGLELMSKAGFNPSGAVTLWQNMRQANGKQVPEWMSTHPSPDTRIKDLKASLPRFTPLYQQQNNKPKC